MNMNIKYFCWRHISHLAWRAGNVFENTIEYHYYQYYYNNINNDNKPSGRVFVETGSDVPSLKSVKSIHTLWETLKWIWFSEIRTPDPLTVSRKRYSLRHRYSLYLLAWDNWWLLKTS